MKQPIQVAIYGQSIAWAAIEAALHKLPHISVIRCAESHAGLAPVEASVDVILFASDAADSGCTQAVNGPALLKLDFDSARLIEPLDHQKTAAVDDLILAIQGKRHNVAPDA